VSRIRKACYHGVDKRVRRLKKKPGICLRCYTYVDYLYRSPKDSAIFVCYHCKKGES